MSSPFEGLSDSWQDRKERDRHASTRLRWYIYRVLALVAAAVLGAGVGSVVEAGDLDLAGRRVGGAVLFGSLMAGVLFAALVRQVVRSQMFGRESGLDRGWMLAAVPVCGAVIGAPRGSVILLPIELHSVGYRGGQAGAVVGVALMLVAWRIAFGRTRRCS